jgi:hypothetical protein
MISFDPKASGYERVVIDESHVCRLVEAIGNCD